MTTVLFAASIIVLVLVGPIFIRVIEQNVEVFFLAVGLLTAFFSGQLKWKLVEAAIFEPLSFTLAVLVFGIAFRWSRGYLDALLARLIFMIEPLRICFYLTIVLSVLAPFITPVVAALVAVEAIALLRLDRDTEKWAAVLGCYAIGFGSSITPLGMPGIAVVLHSLHADFWYLARLLGPFVVVGIVLASLPILFLPASFGTESHISRSEDSWTLVVLTRPIKIYAFIAGLVALAGGLRPTLDRYLHHIPRLLMFWLNTVSAVVNNSTLAAIEIGPTLSASQQRAALLGLVISGGILVTGNLPNIVAASSLEVTSREWARIGLTVGIPLLVLYFLVLMIVG